MRRSDCEGDWREVLGPDVALLHSLAHIPQFAPGAAGWSPIPSTLRG